MIGHSTYPSALTRPELEKAKNRLNYMRQSTIQYGHLLMILSQCLRAASNPSLNNLANSRNAGPSTPPRTSRYSRGNLNGAASNPMFPGEFESMKPKSMCTRCPSRSSKMFPLCRSLIWRKYVTREYPKRSSTH